MQAALELIAEQGFHGTPMSQVASQAEVGVGSIYRYFKDKDELIHAIHTQVKNRMEVELATGHAPDSSQKQQFVSLATLMTQYFIDNPIVFKFIEQYCNSPYGIEKKREKFIDKPITDNYEGPFHNTLSGDSLKDLPKPMIHALAFGPLIFSVREHLAGSLKLDDAIIGKVAEGCWDAISKSEVYENQPSLPIIDTKN